MCGIAGIFSVSGRLPDRNTDQSALKAMRNRGPDASGVAEIDLRVGQGRLYPRGFQSSMLKNVQTSRSKWMAI